MAGLSEHEQAVRALLLQTRPDAAALGDAMINDLVQGKNPKSGSGGPGLKLDLWPLIEEVIKWLPFVSAAVSVVSNSIKIKETLLPATKPSVPELADAVIEQLRKEDAKATYDRKVVENAVEKALERARKP